nr:hypothetical protein BaRGS_030478 [Batillaria attramentaria]KAG5703834.1 hypothetical protein BaRGS_031468 [Batillaria attramentaria]
MSLWRGVFPSVLKESDLDTWVLVVEELMLYLMILGRWLLPRGEVGREQLSQLLFAFIGIASDIMVSE